MKELVELQVTSFEGAFNGEHYYGSLNVHLKSELVTHENGSTSLITRAGHGVEKHKHDKTSIERKIGAKEAAYLNKKDAGGFVIRSGSYRSGDKTERFNDKPSVIKVAIDTFNELFDEDDLLAIDKEVWISGVLTALSGPPHIVEYINSNPDYEIQMKYLRANGYLIKSTQNR